uniref:LIM domain only 4 n=1 Tax=Equus caballus TaxID=9796 RepID=A0A3Q2LJ97_HORSE
MVNPGSSSQPPPVTAGSLSWKRCAGCGGKIADRFLLYAMDSYWHSRCLKCSCCQAQLGDIGTSCYTKSGMILCRNDYIRNLRYCRHSKSHIKLRLLLLLSSSQSNDH